VSDQSVSDFMQEQGEEKHPSAGFLYELCLEDYKQVTADLDRLDDRILIAAAVCGAMLIAVLNTLDGSIFARWSAYPDPLRIAAGVYAFCALGSAVLLAIVVVKLLLLSGWKAKLAFDNISAKSSSLSSKGEEEAALWAIQQYRCLIPAVGERTAKKRKSFHTALILVIIALLAYAVAVIIYRGALTWLS